MIEAVAGVYNTGGRLLFKYTFPTYHLLCGDVVADRDGNEWVVVQRRWNRWGSFDLIVKCYLPPTTEKADKSSAVDDVVNEAFAGIFDSLETAEEK